MSTTLVSNGVTTSAECVVTATGANYVSVSTDSSERARVDSSGNVLIGTTSATTRPTTGSLSVANTFGFKNLLINGAMLFNQRGAASYTINNTGLYTLDRWFGSDNTDGTFTVEPITGPSRQFLNALRVKVTVIDSALASNQYAYVAQAIEGCNVASTLGWGSSGNQPATLAFWVRSSVTGTFGASIASSLNDVSYPFTYTINAANTWEEKVFTIPGTNSGTWNTTNGVGLLLRFSLGAGTTYSGINATWNGSDKISVTGARNAMATLNLSWDLAGVQLEKGTAATSFDYRPYTTELQLCQRYYQKGNITIGGYAAATNAVYGGIAYPVQMRSTPTAATVGAVSYNNTSSFGIGAVTSDSFTAYATISVTASGTASAVYSLDAEL